MGWGGGSNNLIVHVQRWNLVRNNGDSQPYLVKKAVDLDDQIIMLI